MKKEIRDEIFNEFNRKLCKKESYNGSEYFEIRTGNYNAVETYEVKNFIEYVISLCESHTFSDGYKEGFRNGYDECREIYKELFTKISLKDKVKSKLVKEKEE